MAMRPHAAGDCKRESSPRAAPQLAKMQSQVGRQGQSRVRPGQVADAMRVRTGVAIPTPTHYEINLDQRILDPEICL
jgi:hypothetical protein